MIMLFLSTQWELFLLKCSVSAQLLARKVCQARFRQIQSASTSNPIFINFPKWGPGFIFCMARLLITLIHFSPCSENKHLVSYLKPLNDDGYSKWTCARLSIKLGMGIFIKFVGRILRLWPHRHKYIIQSTPTGFQRTISTHLKPFSVFPSCLSFTLPQFQSFRKKGVIKNK